MSETEYDFRVTAVTPDDTFHWRVQVFADGEYQCTIGVQWTRFMTVIEGSLPKNVTLGDIKRPLLRMVGKEMPVVAIGRKVFLNEGTELLCELSTEEQAARLERYLNGKVI